MLVDVAATPLVRDFGFSAVASGRGRVVVVNASGLKVVEKFLVEVPAGLEVAHHSSRWQVERHLNPVGPQSWI